MTFTISSVVSSTVTSLSVSIRKEMSHIEHQNDIGYFINIMKNYVESSDKHFESIQNSFIALGVPDQTPSEAVQGPHGVRT